MSTMLRGTNAFFGLLGGEAALKDLVDHGVQIVRDGPAPTPEVTDEQLAAKMSEYVAFPQLVLWYIVGAQGFWKTGEKLTPEDMTQQTQRVCQAAIQAGLKTIWLECCNEPNAVGAEHYASLVRAMYDAVSPFRHQLGMEITCCSVGRHNQENLNWVQQVINADIPLGVILSPHDYPVAMNPMNPETDFRSLDEQDAAWKAVASGRRLACGEVGYWDGEGGLSETQAMGCLKTEMETFEKYGYVAVTTYQLRNGDDMKPINRCGLTSAQGVWKPGADRIFHTDHAPAEPGGPGVPLPLIGGGSEPPAVPFGAGSMKVALRLEGKLIGVDPNDPTGAVYADRAVVGAWEEVELHPIGGGLFSARFIASDRQLSSQPGGELESRPSGDVGAYETFSATHQPDGEDFLYRVIEPGRVAGVLTIEEVA